MLVIVGTSIEAHFLRSQVGIGSESFVKQLSSVSEPLLGDLGVTYAIHLYLVGKLIVDFL